ncbi:Uncharacterized protein APZ42_023505 [Daphnia magna]|uniref:Uncharacterized protein n=1 Tax=Daphnia magna TaxID=35525 RepID=A0A164UY01_9CRUS|nr:Uncharacterized protein APZ42_023505 [Daphnia magna]
MFLNSPYGLLSTILFRLATSLKCFSNQQQFKGSGPDSFFFVCCHGFFPFSF